MKQKLNFTKLQWDEMSQEERETLAEALWTSKKRMSDAAKARAKVLKEKYGDDYFAKVNAARKTRRGKNSKLQEN